MVRLLLFIESDGFDGFFFNGLFCWGNLSIERFPQTPSKDF